MRPTEVRLVADLLSNEAESVEDLAEQVIRELDLSRKKRPAYVVRVSLGDRVFGLGPFATASEAVRAAGAMHPDADKEALKRAVHTLLPATVLEEPEFKTTAGYCPTCRHPKATHNWPRTKQPGCVITGCDCGKEMTAA